MLIHQPREIKLHKKEVNVLRSSALRPIKRDHVCACKSNECFHIIPECHVTSPQHLCNWLDPPALIVNIRRELPRHSASRHEAAKQQANSLNTLPRIRLVSTMDSPMA